jgi:hypothetical protein
MGIDSDMTSELVSWTAYVYRWNGSYWAPYQAYTEPQVYAGYGGGYVMPFIKVPAGYYAVQMLYRWFRPGGAVGSPEWIRSYAEYLYPQLNGVMWNGYCQA